MARGKKIRKLDHDNKFTCLGFSATHISVIADHFANHSTDQTKFT